MLSPCFRSAQAVDCDWGAVAFYIWSIQSPTSSRQLLASSFHRLINSVDYLRFQVIESVRNEEAAGKCAFQLSWHVITAIPFYFWPYCFLDVNSSLWSVVVKLYSMGTP